MVTNFDERNFPKLAGGAISTDLIVDNFVSELLSNTQNLTKDLLDLFALKLSRATKLPM